ncbi:hypothetical protein Nepgr_007787 [Nepenthes gracilis]|uniref:Uncharacterized protein n=1 Tax=Nepenthes gracilis TaxID=150966 RepID=A0AAD3S7I0_NEPGR|nr:hypothetical protein Nepgr_007787 [Nepenthes gracilis]
MGTAGCSPGWPSMADVAKGRQKQEAGKGGRPDFKLQEGNGLGLERSESLSLTRERLAAEKGSISLAYIRGWVGLLTWLVNSWYLPVRRYSDFSEVKADCVFASADLLTWPGAFLPIARFGLWWMPVWFAAVWFD